MHYAIWKLEMDNSGPRYCAIWGSQSPHKMNKNMTVLGIWGWERENQGRMKNNADAGLPFNPKMLEERKKSLFFSPKRRKLYWKVRNERWVTTATHFTRHYVTPRHFTRGCGKNLIWSTCSRLHPTSQEKPKWEKTSKQRVWSDFHHLLCQDRTIWKPKSHSRRSA